MDFEKLFAILSFCIGAVFTLIDVGSDSFLAFEYWNNSQYRSFEHCVEYRLTGRKWMIKPEVDAFKFLFLQTTRISNSTFTKYEKQLNEDQWHERNNYCKHWREKQLKAQEQTNYDDCLDILLDGTNISDLIELESNEMLSFMAYTLHIEEVVWLKALCVRTTTKKLDSWRNQSSYVNEIDIPYIYENDQECHLYYREKVETYYKLVFKFFDGPNKFANFTSTAFLSWNLERSWSKWWRMFLISKHCKDWRNHPIPVKAVSVSIANDEIAQRPFAIFTTSWILAGGLFQFFVVLYLFYRRDSRLQVLPKWIRILLLIVSPILLGPVVVYVFGVFFVMKNTRIGSIQEDIQR